MQPLIANLDIEQKRSLIASLMNPNRSPLQLSITQERLWQLDQLQPGTPIFNFQTALEFRGILHPKALEIAALQVVLRHQVLQTRYGIEKGKPALSLAPPQYITIAQHDLSALPEQEKNKELETLGLKDVQGSFDLRRPPLLRLTLVRLAPQKHQLFLTMHHIVSDFLSLDLFLFEMGACYSAVLNDQPVSLPLISTDYQDFARMQRSREANGLQETHLGYWRRTLSGASPIEWFSDHVRPAQATGKANTEFFRFPATLMDQIGTFARKRNLTPYIVLLAGFNVLLHGSSGQTDLIVGSPTAGRVQSDYESLIGMFSYPLLMRTAISGSQDFNAFLQQVRKTVLEAAEHADVPLARVANALRNSELQQGSLVRAMLSYVSQLRDLYFEGLSCRRCSTNRGITDIDLFMTLYPDQGEWHGVFEYSTDLFESHTIRTLIAAYLDILQDAVNDPALSVATLSARVPLTPPRRITVAATFTADPLLEVFDFWAKELDLPFTAVLAPYNQLLQQLRDPHGELFRQDCALNVLLVRPQDWIRDVNADFGKQKQVMECSTREFISGVRDAALAVNCPIKIYICPASSPIDAATASLVFNAESSIREELSGIDALEVVDARECIRRYSVEEFQDLHADRIASIPYKAGFYAAMGSAIVRQFRAQVSKPCKVLVLDCDNTLWQGLCAEAGPLNVVITEGHRALQKFALDQVSSGVLVCLNSKNEPEHVLAVLRQNPAMIIKEENISAYRINWASKSSNLQSLAAELALGVDCFCFIDDDAKECAEMSARCPEAVTLRLPEDPAEIPYFLEHLWIFDRGPLSKEDRKRTAFYRDNQRRDLARRQSSTLAEFLETLELRVDLRPAAPDQFLRIAQLSQRTNQFNSSGVVFNLGGLQQAVSRGLEILSVEVSDRFGDYGLCGAVTYRKDKEFLSVENFYLSCRVLGRGVEHRILSELGCIALASNLSWVRIIYREASRNQPFRHFLNCLQGRHEPLLDGSCAFLLTASAAVQSKLTCQEEEVVVTQSGSSSAVQGTALLSSQTAAALARLPRDLATSAQILARLQASRSARRTSNLAVPFAPPESGLESTIACEWGAILPLDKIGRNDNFFDLGGNSLLLVQLNSNLIGKLGVDINISEMFQYPTIASFAAHIAGQTSSSVALEVSARAARIKSRLQEHGRRVAVH